jgi:predicted MFS family arabinose efflux permease
MLLALFFAGTATFAQLYAPQVALPQIAEWFETSEAGAGLLISSATIGLAIGVIPWGIAAQRWGTVPVMTVAISGAAVVGLAVPFLPGYELLLAGRFVEGVLLAGVPAVAIAYIAQEVTPADVTRATAALISGNGLGGMLGRFVSGPLSGIWDWRVGVLAVAVICAGCAIAFVSTIPASRIRAQRVARPSAEYAKAFRANLALPEQRALYVLGFLLMGVSVATYNYLGFAVQQEPFGLSPLASTLVFLAYVSGMIAAPRAGALSARLGRWTVLIATIAITITGLLLTAVPSLPLLIIGLLVATAGFFSSHSIAASWAAASAPRGGALQASAAYSLSYYAGSSVVGWLAGVVLAGAGWVGTVVFLMGLMLLALVVAAVTLRSAAGGRSAG